MLGEHHYAIELEWEGDRGEGTSSYRAYGRQHAVRAEGKLHEIAGSSDRVFHGDRDRWNPEELVLAALSECHMLSYLHVATQHGVVVVGYSDAATARMLEDGRGGGRLVEAVLHPRVTVAEPAMREVAASLHHEASEKCFIAASVNFPVHHEPVTLVRDEAAPAE
ncbi:organic hydroperoxide reductase OsmC/OhrA [Agromyces flavus]|uniref:Organic hydroperoxide reductase OsmC/OhrA n=1 Tax=Agromyces flavus TaxID=589382 RepID=A0A1H1TUL8_9MICO|nr:OsmC family protein [Agromyces flavus]MCP2368354.1 organic hydroperoxide reductase OsmC/OhrA [Agromyces flavus]GGI47816.1 peroxiredoxin [Agromyces flavus]SDS63791.1 Organic hydroperoxide reductase OsmC/OhrA [Agromyces flavus]